MDSFIRPNRLFTVEQSVILHTAGKVNDAKLKEVRAKIRSSSPDPMRDLNFKYLAEGKRGWRHRPLRPRRHHHLRSEPCGRRIERGVSEDLPEANLNCCAAASTIIENRPPFRHPMCQ